MWASRALAVVLALTLRAGPAATVSAMAKAPATAEPREALVPPALRSQMETVEPSGLVWVPSLRRYLVVADDAGTAEQNHRPWLLAMDRDGHFDAAVVPILGLTTLNDPEAICAGPDGSFFLITSHSPTKRGKTPEDRRQLLLLGLEGRSLRVRGRVDLTTARTVEQGGLDAILGVRGRLDIEGLTVREGALWIGLKSPLGAGGEAIVLALENPVALVTGGVLPPGVVKRVRAFPLRVPGPEGREVAQGIADLLSLPDGTLVVLANAPKGMPKDAGGALYTQAPGERAPVLRQVFSGLRPEGVAVADDGKGLIVVFDHGEETPLWLRWPLAK